jgi:hypothetical protein
MKINFTQAEYRILLELIYCGEWMLKAHREADEPPPEPYEMLAQKIYSHAGEMGCEEFIEAHEEDGMYYPTQKLEFESGALEIISTYNEDCFWDELTNRMTMRDVLRKHPELADQPERMEEYWKRAEPVEARYADEFTEHGIERLEIVRKK